MQQTEPLMEKIDEFRIYNRTLLEEEIKILYDTTNPTGPKNENNNR